MRFSLLFLLICLCVFLAWLAARDQRIRTSLRRIGKGIAIAAGVVLAVLAVRAVPYLAALLPLLVPLFIRRFSHALGPKRAAPFGQPYTSADPNARRGPKASRVTTRFFAMELDHESGAMSGQVLQGSFSGRMLHDLDQAELIALWHESRTDPQSQAVLEAFLQRAYPDWQQHVAQEDRSYNDPDAGLGDMDRDEALAILGLSEDADEGEIRAAHRRLIQRLHPDQGGSDYLASRINWAKDLLLHDKQ